MMNNQNIDGVDQKIMRMRALGYGQLEIANMLGISQSAVSQRIHKIRQTANSMTAQNNNTDQLFWTLILGVGAYYLIKDLLKGGERK